MAKRLTHCMLDIETLGKGPYAVVVSIGAAKFTSDGADVGTTFEVLIDPADAQRRGLQLDAETVMWWLHQSNAARLALTSSPVQTLPMALGHLTNFWNNAPCAERAWAFPPTFDIVILENAYRAVGEKPPWSYRQVRCARTLADLAGFGDMGSATIKEVLGAARAGLTEHRAQDDAIEQARLVQYCYQRMRHG